MTSDLIKLSDVLQYIFQQTGQLFSFQQVEGWARIGEIQLVQPQDQDRRFRWTTKQIVDEFIRKYSEEQNENI